jgi:hypothetical protein
MTELTPLAARIAKLRASTNTSPLSEATNTTPLETYIRLYNKAKGSENGGGSCYTNYMEGARALYAYLSPIEIPDTTRFSKLAIPAIFHGYEVGALVQTVFYPVSLVQVDGMSTEEYFAKVDYLKNLVVYYTARHILEEAIN